MPQAEFTVTFPDTIWLGPLSRSFPDVTFRVLAALPADDRGHGLVELVGDEADAAATAFERRDAVTSVKFLHRAPKQAIIQFETTDPALLLTIQEAGLPLELPVEIRDGEVTLEVTGSRPRISALADQLDALGFEYTLDRLYRHVDVDEGPLTDRQRDLLVTALRQGYYDTPRQTSLTEVADTLDLAPSTVSEVLHRAEETVVKTFASERLDGVDIEPGPSA